MQEYRAVSMGKGDLAIYLGWLSAWGDMRDH